MDKDLKESVGNASPSTPKAWRDMDSAERAAHMRSFRKPKVPQVTDERQERGPVSLQQTRETVPALARSERESAARNAVGFGVGLTQSQRDAILNRINKGT